MLTALVAAASNAKSVHYLVKNPAALNQGSISGPFHLSHILMGTAGKRVIKVLYGFNKKNRNF